MVVLVIEGLSGMAAIQDRLKTIVENHNKKIALVNDMRTAARERSIILYRMATLEDPFERDELFLVFNRYAAEFARARVAFLDINLSEEEKSILQEQGRLTGNAVDLQEQVIDLAIDEEYEQAILLLNQEAIPAQDAVFEKLNLLGEAQREAAQTAVEEANNAYERAWLLMLLYGALAVLIGVVVSLVVYRASVRSQERLVREKERAQVTLHSIGDGVITINSRKEIIYLNSVAEEMTGWLHEEASGRPVTEVFELVDEQGGLIDFNPMQKALEGSGIVQFEEHSHLRRNDGQVFAIEITIAPLPDYDKQVTGSVLTFRNVTTLRDMARQMSYQATHDALTGLINRREFENRLRQALMSTQGGRNSHVLCYMDLDQFKVVNDTCGHVAGDELLKQLASLTYQKIRKDDTLGRLGGDEFGILLLDCPLDKGRETVESILDMIREFRFLWQDKSFEVGASVGLVPITDESGSIEELLSAADSACYVAKDFGRNRVHVYQPDDEALATRHGEMQWFQRIRNALDHDDFELYYQKIVSLKDEQLHGIEILIRLKTDQRGVIDPEIFLPAAERYGLMPMIDHWVIENAFSSLSELRNKNSELSRLPIAINLSGQTLCEDGLVDFIKDCFERYEVNPQQICFELTETAAVANLSQAIKVLGEMKSMGCNLALDDFGSGLSSFKYLRNLPMDFLKIDGSFVRDMVSDPMDRAMVESINEIGHLMGLQTIAEFVENDEILQKLREMGVDYAQGFSVHVPEALQEK